MPYWRNGWPGRPAATLERLSTRNPQLAQLERGASGHAHRSAVLAVLRDEERKLQGLLVVEARIDGGSVSPLEVAVRQAARTAGALGYVVAGQLDVDSAEMRAVLRMDLERQL